MDLRLDGVMTKEENQTKVWDAVLDAAYASQLPVVYAALLIRLWMKLRKDLIDCMSILYPLFFFLIRRRIVYLKKSVNLMKYKKKELML